MTDYRAGLPERPKRMLDLPLNVKGYPVPWFVEQHPGVEPDFRIMDGEKWSKAVRFRMCWLCGQIMGKHQTFVAGPMCGINRTSSEPPSHHECAEYAAKACPFLTLPKALRRTAGMPDGVVEGTKIDGRVETNVVGGIALTRNPGVTMLWTCYEYGVQRVPNGAIIKMGEPTGVEWYAQGRHATRAEVEESIRTGMPALQEMADEQGGDAPAHLARLTERFERYLPM